MILLDNKCGQNNTTKPKNFQYQYIYQIFADPTAGLLLIL